MSVTVRLAGFALVLLAVFGAGLGLGAAVGPVGVASVQQEQVPDPGHDMSEQDMTDEEMSR